MSNIWREFYDVEGASKVIGVTVDDLWHLIEVGKIGASFRRVLAESTISIGNEISIDDYIASAYTFLININDASLIIAKGKCAISEARLQLEHPRETIDINGEVMHFFDSEIFELDSELEIKKEDLVITKRSIDKFLHHSVYKQSKAVVSTQNTSSPLSNRERETMVKIIHALAKNGYKYPNHGSVKEMVDDFERSGNGVSEKTLKKYLDEFDTL